jgi:hypothetical protein
LSADTSDLFPCYKDAESRFSSPLWEVSVPTSSCCCSTSGSEIGWGNCSFALEL